MKPELLNQLTIADIKEIVVTADSLLDGRVDDIDYIITEESYYTAVMEKLKENMSNLTWQTIAKIITIYEQEVDAGSISRYGDAKDIQPYCEKILGRYKQLYKGHAK